MTGREGRIVTFYSYKGGTGRTMVLANLAWILAGGGKRVLAVDWDLESPGLHRFLHPFLDLELVADTPGVIDLIRGFQWAAARARPERSADWYREHADLSRNTVSVNWGFPNGGVLHFMPAGRQNQDYSATLSSLNWDEFYQAFDGGRFFDAVRESFRRDYDYVLIDSRTGLSDIAQICTLQLPDVLVALFTLSDQGIDGVSSVVQQVGEQFGRRGIRILPVPARVDEAEKDKADNGRLHARGRFPDLPRGMDDARRSRYWGDVEIPYRPFYAYEEILAVFGDRADAGPSSLRAAMERLARYVCDDPSISAPPIDEPERARLVAAFTRQRPTHPGDVLLFHVAENHGWADWIAQTLERHGVHVLRHDVDSAMQNAEVARAIAHNRILAVISPAFTRSRQATAFVRRVADTDPSADRGRLTAVFVAEPRAVEPFAAFDGVDLTRLDEPAATRALLGALGLGAAAPRRADADTHRFPGSVPRIWNVGPRNAAFTGRGPVLDGLRDQLASRGSAVVLPVAVHGLGGVGKTQLALEYAHRFKADYDLVWWIDAEVPGFIDASLAELAERLGATVGASLPEAAREALETLRLGRMPYQRWLLIYDNARDPGELAGYLPSGTGHVLITSRNQTWSEVAEALEVDVFTREESIEHLVKRLPSLSAEDTGRLADRLDNLPLAIEVAAAWLAETGTPIGAYLEELDGGSTSLLSLNQPTGYSRTLEGTWQISLDRLAERSRPGVRMLELCAFMAPSISVDLIYGQRTMDALAPFDPALRVPGMLGRVTQEITRLALARIDRQHGELQIHRLMQDFLRNRLSTREQQDRLRLVHEILTEARPSLGGADDPRNWPQYSRIWPHLEPSRAIECDEDPMRTLLIDRVRFLWKRDQHTQALELGRRLDDRWSAALADGGPDDEGGRTLLRQLLLLRFQLGNVYRSQGEFDKARTLNEQVLAAQREALGEDDLHTLMTAAGLAGDLRGLGEYRAALEMDKRTSSRFKLLFGEDHERSLFAASNQAVSHRLNGEVAAALAVDAETLERRRQVLGPKHPHTLQSQLALAQDHLDLGDYRQATPMLETAYRDYVEVLGPNSIDTLRTATALAIALRCTGDHPHAKALTEETAARFADGYAASNPDALACRLNVAADLAATGEFEPALTASRDALGRYAFRHGSDHPFTNVARNNHGCYLLRAGHAEEALEQLRTAHGNLSAVLGTANPFTQGAGINLANALAVAGLLEAAVELNRSTQRQLVERAGSTHPMTLVCSANLSLDLGAIGRAEQAHSLRQRTLAQLAETLGEDHPTVAAAKAGLRLDQELVPQPT